MLNKAPIFVNGFQRGGTNILMNLLISHPDVCGLDRETHEIFYGKYNDPLLRKLISRMLYIPILAGTGQHLFGYRLLAERKHLRRPLSSYLDFLFYGKKVLNPDNKQKRHANGRTPRQQTNGRLLCKNVNAIVLLSPTFAAMYPDATFIALTRNGLAICEGFIRRGATAAEVGELYDAVGRQMVRDAERLENYHIVRFEDILADPQTAVQDIYAKAGLNFTSANRFRLQAKPSIAKNGSAAYMFGGVKDREVHWFSLEELPQVLRTDVNDNQIARLDPADKAVFMEKAGSMMQHFGYA
jgi:hypothetical protein